MINIRPVTPKSRDRGLCIHISVGQNNGHKGTLSNFTTVVMSAEHIVCEQSLFTYQTCKLFVEVQGFYSCEAIFFKLTRTGRAKEKPIVQNKHELCCTCRLYKLSSKTTKFTEVLGF